MRLDESTGYLAGVNEFLYFPCGKHLTWPRVQQLSCTTVQGPVAWRKRFKLNDIWRFKRISPSGSPAFIVLQRDRQFLSERF